MTNRQKLCLKALLAVTFPIWIVPLGVGLILWEYVVKCAWTIASAIVDDLTA